MSNFIRSYYKTLIFFGAVGLVGGFFLGLYALDSYPEAIINELKSEIVAAGLGDFPLDILLAVTTALQSAMYGILLGGIGICLAKHIGLWRDERYIEAKPLIAAISVSVLGGLFMILSDILYLAKESEAIAASYATKPTIVYMLASVTYGAVIEEVMLRLFTMSLIAFILYKILGKEMDKPSLGMLIAANIISAMLFGIGHIPATLIMLGDSPILIVRCILLNGLISLGFGWLYRKFGLRYAMIAHGGCHVVSKLIWILFI